MLIFNDVLQFGSRRLAFQLILVDLEVRCAGLFNRNGFVSGSERLFIDKFLNAGSIFVLILSRTNLF